MPSIIQPATFSNKRTVNVPTTMEKLLEAVVDVLVNHPVMIGITATAEAVANCLTALSKRCNLVMFRCHPYFH